MSTARRLILIAGPAASGKSVLMDKIRSGECPRLCEQLRIIPSLPWQYTGVYNLILGKDELSENVISHCDLHNKNIFQYTASLLETVESATVVTLCAPSTVLVERNKKRILQRSSELFTPPVKAFKKAKLIRTLWFRQRINMSRPRLRALYNDWFDLLEHHRTENYWLESSHIDDPLALPLERDRSPALRAVHPGT